MALIYQVASLFLPEKSVGRVAFSSEECGDMAGGAVSIVDTRGMGPVTGDGGNGSREASGARDEGGKG